MRIWIWILVFVPASFSGAEAYVGKAKVKLRAEPFAFEFDFDWAAARTLHEFLKSPRTGRDVQCVSANECHFAGGEAIDATAVDGFVTVNRLNDETARFVVKGPSGRKLMEMPDSGPFRCTKNFARGGRGALIVRQSRCEVCFDPEGAIKACP